jgi:Sap, sulfolipid-1-addressing protein
VVALLAGILPFAAGAALTPTMLLVQLTNVTGPGGSRRKGAYYAAGCALVLLVVSALALGLARGTGGAETSPTEVAWVKLVLAAILTAFGVWSILRPERADEPRSPGQRSRRGGAGELGLGAAMMATNFTSLALYFPAMHQIGISGASPPGKVVAFAVLYGATMLPATVPLLPSGRLATTLQRPLERANAFMDMHHRTLVPLVAFGFAGFLAVQGLVNLL